MLKKLQLHNFKIIEDFEMEFNGGVYLVTAENEFGKSTVIGSIFKLLTGDRSDNLLQRGKAKGFAKAEFEHNGKVWIVELRFTTKNKRGRLIITEKGSHFTSNNKSVLESIFGYSDFDVSTFIDWSNSKPGRRKQVEMIKSLFSEKVVKKINAMDAKIESIMEKRKTKGKEAYTQNAIVKNYQIDDEFINEYSKPLPLEPIREKLDKCNARNANIENIQISSKGKKSQLDNWDQYTNEILDPYSQKVDEAVLKITMLEAELKNAKEQHILREREQQEKQDELELEFISESEQLKNQEEWLTKNKVEPMSELNLQLEAAIEHNNNNKKLDEYHKSVEKLNKLQEQHDKFDSEIEKKREERTVIVAANPLPVSGLTFDLDQLYLNGIPFTEDEVSTSQIMETCVRLMIAKNPSCKMFKIGRGESLGAEKFKAIVDFARKEGFQGFVEEVVRGQKELNVFEYTEEIEDES